jgi:hypothetical protein
MGSTENGHERSAIFHRNGSGSLDIRKEILFHAKRVKKKGFS